MLRYETLTDTSTPALRRFDLIIDARSPSEYAEDHLPGAVNLPVLNDDERAEIGVTYVQDSPFRARRAGAALAARNIAHHLQTSLADRPKKFQILVYCWRGGMRSNSFAVILSAVGWSVAVLEGGYQSWRRAVVTGLETVIQTLDVILIDGQTGTAKTRLLTHLRALGGQVIDLENLAAHRGSIFGDFAALDQPSQKTFETGIWSNVEEFDRSRPVFVEAESALIGQRRIPTSLWNTMKAAPRIEITAPVDVRVRYLMDTYTDLIGNRGKVHKALDTLARQHGHEQVAAWRAMADAGEDEALARSLMIRHYDPAYDRSRRKRAVRPAISLPVSGVTDAELEELAVKVLAQAGELGPQRG